MRNFLWEVNDEFGGEHLVAWNIGCKPKELGELDIGHIMKRNKALVMKWLWFGLFCGVFGKKETQ